VNARVVIAAGVLAAALLGARLMTPASGSPAAAPSPPAAPADDAPRGMVAFVEGAACPPGWAPAALAAGRLLVGTDEATAVGHAVGTPFDAVEDRGHPHALSAATVALPYKSISAADGGNQSGAASGAQALTGAVEAAPSGLPFIQLTACVSP
jgi:hypothetical protein